MEREYLAIMKNSYVYLITETSDIEAPFIHVCAYPTGVFADSHIREYLADLPNPNVNYANNGVYYDYRNQRWELTNLGQTLPEDKLYKKLKFAQPKRCKDVRYRDGYWEKYTKAHGWERTYEIWSKAY
ncbi:hypothetical protein ARNL5_01324 [Anaerolineae bacterium]|nr:hypothetical protein ARNL5_01324 [Anaerolineae bacterium]